MRYYYKDDKGNYYNYKSEHEDLIEITEEEWNEHIKQFEREEPTQEQLEKFNIQNQINELKAKLNATDYKAIKYAEGLLTDEEYAETKAQRQEWRDKINALEELSS